MKNVYLAAPEFNEKQKELFDLVKLKLQCNETVGNIFEPLAEENQHNELQFGSNIWKYTVFQQDIDAIKNSDCVVAIVDFLEKDGEIIPDPGTTWEIGYAYALNKPVYLVTEEENPNNKVLNLMIDMGCCSHICLKTLSQYNFNDTYIKRFNWKSV